MHKEFKYNKDNTFNDFIVIKQDPLFKVLVDDQLSIPMKS